jgi:hypothetical protein
MRPLGHPKHEFRFDDPLLELRCCGESKRLRSQIGVVEQDNRHGAQRVGEPPGAAVTFSFEGAEIAAVSTDTVASALLAAGVRIFTTTDVSGDARGGFCFVGRCADCLVIVDGQANQRACLTAVHDGMDIRVQHGHGAVARETGP